MAVTVKDGGVWKTAAQVSVKEGGLWKVADGVWVKQGGVWRQAHSGATNYDLVIASDVSDYNIKSAVISAGWDQVEDINVTLTINAGVVVRSTNHHKPWSETVGYYILNAQGSASNFQQNLASPAVAATPALRTGGFGSALKGLTINNSGIVVGPGGLGGMGGSRYKGEARAGRAAGSGGPAFVSDSDACVFNNLSGATLGGGGDGGYGGPVPSGDHVGYGGGGGAGFGPSGWGTVFALDLYYSTQVYRGSLASMEYPAAEGTATAPGTAWDSSQGAQNGGALGGGDAIQGYSNVTLTNNGTLAGGLTG